MLKKYFYLFLDHIYKFLFLNFIYLLVILGGLGIYLLIISFIPDPNPNFIFLAVGLVMLASNLFNGAAAGIINDIADYKEVRLLNFWQYLRSSALNSILFTLLNTGLIFLSFNSLSFYLSTSLFFAPMANAFIFWLGLLWLVTSQFFFALHYRLEKKFFSLLKKMVLIFLDNMLFSCFCFILLLLITIITTPTLFMLPGLVSLQLFSLVAIRTRLYKYAFLEEQHKNAKAENKTLPKKIPIPWPTLIMDDARQLGKRSLKTTFFPWKK